ncbi:MAG: response regulator transcription factor [Deltaproteobacteria bacterium]|nr:response regulator transcription factor [Deltaproteobacteria bacterium]
MAHILIVEDNPFFRQTLKRMLLTKFPSLEVSEAADGQEALVKIEETLPHLIFMDIALPGEDGIELTQRIRNAYPEMSIVIISNYDTSEYRESALQAGATSFLSKRSSSPSDIFDTVQSSSLV